MWTGSEGESSPTHVAVLPCSYPGQDKVHLQLGHPSAQTRPDSKAKRHRAERVLLGLVLRSPEPPLRLEGVRLRENVLVVGHAVVAEMEQRLREQKSGKCKEDPSGN